MIENSTYAKYRSSNEYSWDFIRIKGMDNMKLDSIYGFLRILLGHEVKAVQIIAMSEYDRKKQ